MALEKEPSPSSQRQPSLFGLLRTLAASLGAFLSSLSNPTLRSDNPKQPKDNANETASVRINPGSTPIRVIIDSVPSPVLPTEEEKTQNDINKRRKTIKFRADLIVGFFIVLYTVVSICLWRSAQHANEISDNSVKNADRNFRIDERAWVAVSDISPDLKQGGELTVSLIFKNTGKTPAKNFIIRGSGESVRKGQKAQGEETKLPGHGVIAPDGVFHSNLSISGRYDWKSIDLILHGRIEYDSVFGNRHWTQFCYYFVPDNKTSKGGFAPCEDGNDTDSNPP